MFDLRRLCLALIVALIPTVALSQDARLEQPKTPAEYWRAVEFELNTGKYDMAAHYLKALLAANPTENDLVTLEEKNGLASFLRLRNVPTWSTDATVQAEAKKNTEEIIGRVNAALEKKFGDSGRIAHFIGNLRASPEERAFAIRELQRSGDRAVPQMIMALRAENDPANRVAVLSVLPLLPESSVAPLLAAMDMKDSRLKLELLQAIGERADFTSLAGRTELNPLPTLDYLAASPNETAEVRRLARDLIVRMRSGSPSNIRPATIELVDAAQRMYKHEAKFVNPDAIPLWRWENDQLTVAPVSTNVAEEYYGLRYARWALALDPNDLQAQVLFLSTAIEKAFQRIGLDGSLASSEPAVYELVAKADVATLIATLSQALADHKTAVALGVTQVLADRADQRAAAATRVSAGVLQRALEYPDRRVQFAAAEAIARLPKPAETNVQAKVVEILREALAGESSTPNAGAKSRVLVIWFDRMQSQHLAGLFNSIGFDVVQVRTGQDAIRRLLKSADIDYVVLDSAVAGNELVDTLSAFRSDARLAGLPVRVIHTPKAVEDYQSTLNEARLRRSTYQTTMLREDEIKESAAAARRVQLLTEDLKNVKVVQGPVSANILRTAFTQDAGTDTKALTPAEKKHHALRAIELFRDMAMNPAAGFDLRPADRTIRQALRNPELAKIAVDVVGRLPSRESQIDLVALILDSKASPELRLSAAENLRWHIQRNGSMLTADQIQRLDALAVDPKNPALHGRVADVIGAIGGTKLAPRMQNYNPVMASPAAAKPEPKKPAEKPAEKPDEPPTKPEED